MSTMLLCRCQDPLEFTSLDLLLGGQSKRVAFASLKSYWIDMCIFIAYNFKVVGKIPLEDSKSRVVLL